MTVPIRPLHGMGYRKEDGSLLDSIDLSVLNDYVSLSPPKNKIVTASDKDADLLLNLWQKKSESSDEISVGEIDNSDILRLKTIGFLTGDVKKVKFTPRARAVITTMVLNEPNRFSNMKQPKSYNEILAAQSKKIKSSRIPKFASSELISLAASYPNQPIPSGLSEPKSSDVYCWSERLTNTNSGSYKEYTVRVYFQNKKYHIWAFNGKIGGTQTPQYKGASYERLTAQAYASAVLSSKKGGGYVLPYNAHYVPDPNPSNKPGKPATTLEELSALEDLKDAAETSTLPATVKAPKKPISPKVETAPKAKLEPKPAPTPKPQDEKLNPLEIQKANEFKELQGLFD